MSSSNSQMRHTHTEKKAALLALWALVVGKSKRRGRLLRPFDLLLHFFERSRIASVEIPIVRVRASFASYHPRVRKKIRNFIKRGGTNHTVDLQSSLWEEVTRISRRISSCLRRSGSAPSARPPRNPIKVKTRAPIARASPKGETFYPSRPRDTELVPTRVSFFFVCAMMMMMMMCFFVYFVSPFSCVFWKRYKTRKKTKRVSLTLLRSSLLQKKPSDYKRSWCRWWPPRTRVFLRFQMVITFSAGSAPSKAPKVRRTKTWNIRWRCRLRTSTRSKRRWWNFPPRVSTQTSISLGIFVWIFWKSNGRRRITWGRFCCPFRVCWESRITIRRWIRTPPDCGRIKRSIESCCRRSIRRTGQRSKWELGIRHAL